VSAGVTSSLAASCSTNGVFSPDGLQLETAGPCTALDGTSLY
jgi:hypothetical protein